LSEEEMPSQSMARWEMARETTRVPAYEAERSECQSVTTIPLSL